VVLALAEKLALAVTLALGAPAGPPRLLAATLNMPGELVTVVLALAASSSQPAALVQVVLALTEALPLPARLVLAATA